MHSINVITIRVLLYMRKGRSSLIPACEETGLSLQMFRSGYSDLLQGEDKASMNTVII